MTLAPTLLAPAPPQSDQRYFLFPQVSWDYYTQTLNEIESAGLHWRVTFDQGRMEIVTTGNKHERIKTSVARLLEFYCLEMDIPINGDGSVTCRREDLKKGLEADECYYIYTETPPLPEGNGPLDLYKYPPPDLAIEVDMSSGSIPKEPIYGALGVPEIWRYVGDGIEVLLRQPDGRYQASATSLAFPKLSIPEFNRFVMMALNTSQHSAAKAMRDWVHGGKTE